MRMHCTADSQEDLQDVIKERAKCTTLKRNRVRYITGGRFNRVVKYKGTSLESIVNQLMQYKSKDRTVQTVMWGKQMKGNTCQCHDE